MLRSLTTAAFVLLTVAATAPGLEPVAPPSKAPVARPLNVVRPIFALPANARPSASGNTRGSASQLHRQPITLTPTKPVEAPKSSAEVNPAPPPRFGISTVPFFRRSLGW